MRTILKRLAIVGFSAGLLAGCGSGLSTDQNAMLDAAKKIAPSSDIDSTDGYVSRTECRVLAGIWRETGGGGGAGVPSGFSFPWCDLTGNGYGVPAFSLTGPTVVGGTGTVLQ